MDNVSNLSGNNYYGVGIKMILVFIDEWPPTGKISLFHDDLNSTPFWEWNY